MWISPPAGSAPMETSRSICRLSVSRYCRLNTSSPVKWSKGVYNSCPQVVIDSKIRPEGPKKLPANDKGWLKMFKQMNEVCYRHQIGNCGELAGIACLRLHEKGVSPVEFVQIWDGVTNNPALPHLVAVIGRGLVLAGTANIDIGKPDTWHADAVICDPWDRAVYPAQDYDKFWKALRHHAARPKALFCFLLHRM